MPDRLRGDKARSVIVFGWRIGWNGDAGREVGDGTFMKALGDMRGDAVVDDDMLMGTDTLNGVRTA